MRMRRTKKESKNNQLIWLAHFTINSTKADISTKIGTTHDARRTTTHSVNCFQLVDVVFFFVYVKYAKTHAYLACRRVLSLLENAYFLACSMWLFLLICYVEHTFENAVFVFDVMYLTYLNIFLTYFKILMEPSLHFF